MIVYDARDSADRPKPQNHVEFRQDGLWINPDAPVTQRKLNIETVRAHMDLSDADNVPALFNFPEQTWDIPNADFKKRLAWWTATWDQIRAVNPSQIVGCYAEVPAIEYYGPIKQYNHTSDPKNIDATNQWFAEKPKLAAVRSLNNKLHAIADSLSIICPSLYLHYDFHSDAQWAAYAKWNFGEARQYGKPVYPVLMPRYHDSLKPIAIERWRDYVKMVRNMQPNGLIIWDYSGHGPWSEVEEHFHV